MRRAELQPGCVIGIPPGEWGPGARFTRPFRMRVRDLAPPDGTARPYRVKVSGLRLNAAGAPEPGQPPLTCRVNLRDVGLERPSGVPSPAPGSPVGHPLCREELCARDATVGVPGAVRRHDASWVTCDRHADYAGAPPGRPVSLDRIEHAPAAPADREHAVLRCDCGWACWLGVNADPLVRDQVQVVSAAHAVCGWRVRPVSGPLDGVVFEGALPLTGTPCWFWLSSRAEQPVMVLWERRNPHLSIQAVRADGFRPSLPAHLPDWPVELTHSTSVAADRAVESERARRVAFAYIGDATGRLPSWVGKTGKRGPAGGIQYGR